MTELAGRDYTLIVDKSGSMATKDMPGGKTRWEAAKESTFALASKCESFDPDGITVYTFSSAWKKYENTTAAKVDDIWKENEPMGGTELHTVLKDAFDGFFSRKKAGTSKENGEIILVVTDGEPSSQKDVARVIVDASKKLDRDEELAVSFLQIGKDEGASRFLKSLDDDLTGQGAKFDIVDTVTFEEAENMTMTELLLKAAND